MNTKYLKLLYIFTIVISTLSLTPVPSLADWSAAKCFAYCNRFTCKQFERYSDCLNNCKSNQIPLCKNAYETPIEKRQQLEARQGEINIATPQTTQCVKAQDAVHPPLVTELKDGHFDVNPKANNLRQEMSLMSKFAFLIRKEDPTVPELFNLFKADGWEITEFLGRTGLDNSMEDKPGFVAYRKCDNTMIVTFRGSDSSQKNPNTPKTNLEIAKLSEHIVSKIPLSADWEVNFDSAIIDTPYGKMHKGFYNKAEAAHSSLMQVIAGYIEKLSQQDRMTIQIFFTGHSQGAALAPIAAADMVNDPEFKRLLAWPDFDNKRFNTVQVYVFSAPRAYGDQRALDELYAALGKKNIIRQNVIGNLANDPVSVIVPGKTATALLNLVPVAGQYLGNKYGGGSGTLSVGYLAGDLSSDVYQRVAPSELKSLYIHSQDRSVGVVGKIKNMITAAFAPLHYGGIQHNSPVEDGNAYTSINAMSGAPSIKKLLEQGYAHKGLKRSGLQGTVRRGIERAANIKVAIENKLIRRVPQLRRDKVQTNLSPQVIDKKDFNSVRSAAE